MKLKEVTVRVTPALVLHATEVARSLQHGIGLDEPWTSLRSYLDAQARLALLRRSESTLGADFRGGLMLEIGSGIGMFVAVASRLGLDVVGVEPAANSYGGLRAAIDELLSANGLPDRLIIPAPAEALPWPDGTFDHVVSFQVLEHVVDPARVLSEAARVLKPGGDLYMEMPNYRSFVEGHFGLAWCPALCWSKRVAKAYVAAAGRNPAFLDEINFVTEAKLVSWTAGLPLAIDISHTPRDGMDSPTTEGVVVTVDGVGPYPLGRRFSGWSDKVKRITAHPRIAAGLARFGLAEHVVLTGTKYRSAS